MEKTIKKFIALLVTICLLNLQITLPGQEHNSFAGRTIIDWGIASAHAQSINFTPEGEDALESSQMMTLIIMVGVSVVVANLLAGCVGWKRDVIAAAVAAAAFIYSEISAWGAYNDIKFKTVDGACGQYAMSLDGTIKNTAQTEAGAGNSQVAGTNKVRDDASTESCNMQRQTLQDMREQYSELKTVAEGKKSKQTIAAMAWLAAAAFAAWDAWQLRSAQTKCQAALKTAGVAAGVLAKEYAAAENYPSAAICEASQGMSYATVPVVSGIGESMEVPALSTISSEAVNAGMTTLSDNEMVINKCQSGLSLGCSEYKILGVSTLVQCEVKGLSAFNPMRYIPFSQSKDFSLNGHYQHGTLLSMALNKASSLLISSAYAGGVSPFLGMGAAAIAYFTASKLTSASTVDLFMSSPMKRALVWGALAGVAYYTAGTTQEIIDAMDKNVKDIDTILANMDNSPSNGVIDQGAITNEATTDLAVTAGSKVSGNAKSATSGGGIGGTNGNGGKALACVPANQSCANIGATISSLGATGGAFPSDFAASASAISALGSATTPAAFSAAGGSLAGQQGFLKNAHRDLMKKLLDTKEGKQAAKEARGLLNRIHKDAMAQLKSKGMDEAAVNSSLGGMNGTFASALARESEGDKKTKDEKKKVAALDMAGASMMGGGIEVSQGSSLSSDLISTDTFKEDEVAVGGDDEAALAQANYDYSGASISKADGPSIFDLITTRYVRSAFPRLLNKIETTPVESSVKEKK